jgi:hypothetical protein
MDVKKSSGEELLDEIEWLLDGQVHPLLIAQELHLNRASVRTLARRHGRDRVAEAFLLDGAVEKSVLRGWAA